MIYLESIEQFKELKKQHTVYLFSADWCPDCRYLEPFLGEIEAMYPYMQFVYVDRDKFIDICQAYNIYGIPSFVVYKNEQLVGTFISKFRKTKQEIIDFLETVK
ncbi:MAG TPA: thioredoxin family protein [Haloplasmataceae bacterium]